MSRIRIGIRAGGLPGSALPGRDLPGGDLQGAAVYGRDLHGAGWRKSSRSGPTGGNCVETASLPGGAVAVRDSRYPGGPALIFTAARWDAFVSGLKPRALRLPETLPENVWRVPLPLSGTRHSPPNARNEARTR
jgi:Domain of unknown function (DUF397)